MQAWGAVVAAAGAFVTILLLVTQSRRDRGVRRREKAQGLTFRVETNNRTSTPHAEFVMVNEGRESISVAARVLLSGDGPEDSRLVGQKGTAATGTTLLGVRLRAGETWEVAELFFVGTGGGFWRRTERGFLDEVSHREWLGVVRPKWSRP
jgi:hypothetical protein